MTVPASLFTLYETIADDFINTDFGVNCKIYYHSKPIVCPNCIVDTMTQKSTGRYKSGGPISFTNGMICPVCNGDGYKDNEATDTIKMKIYFDAKYWKKITGNIISEDTVAQGYGFMSDLPKLQQAKYITLDTDLTGYGLFNVVLDGRPTPHGFTNKYFLANFRNA
jgi:hypothetical protein